MEGGREGHSTYNFRLRAPLSQNQLGTITPLYKEETQSSLIVYVSPAYQIRPGPKTTYTVQSSAGYVAT